MLTKTLLWFVAPVALVVGVEYWLRADRSVVDRLEHPVAKSAVDQTGITLHDGTRHEWGFTLADPALVRFVRVATARGVEVTPDQHAVGLVSVWRWCGNDPIRTHLARVDIDRALEFFTGASMLPLQLWSRPGRDPEWNVSQWWEFEQWCARDPGRIYDPPSGR